MSDQPRILVQGLAKTFTLHAHDAAEIPVFADLDLAVAPGECVALVGPSGAGKSTLMRAIYGNYLPSAGTVKVLHDGAYVDLVGAPPATILDVRRRTMGYVSQFLRVIPRIATIDLVMQPLLENGASREEAHARASAVLTALNLPEDLWPLPPATFSGGEQQRVNLARSLVRDYPILLLDEPTASLDAANRDNVVKLIRDALARGAAMIGIFHDSEVRERIATHRFAIEKWPAAA
ncbi:MAG: phosphonate C-P lyase system protein PhnL [Caulobacterales bacterium]|jgi:alpha-D-ribose 1-methylphosphonate 5-triphosphate synthase subunit PhnL